MFNACMAAVVLVAIIGGISHAKPKAKAVDATVLGTHNNDIRLSYYDGGSEYHLDCTYSSGDKGYPKGAAVKLQVVNNGSAIITYKPEFMPLKTTKLIIITRRAAPEPKPKKD